MTKTLLAAAALVALATPALSCDICNAPLFKKYTSCIDAAIPQWDPKGPVLSKMNFDPAKAVGIVLLQCEPIVVKFGKKYGNNLANTLQSVAEQKVSEQYGVEVAR
jgi:hypothetical protein